MDKFIRSLICCRTHCDLRHWVTCPGLFTFEILLGRPEICSCGGEGRDDLKFVVVRGGDDLKFVVVRGGGQLENWLKFQVHGGQTSHVRCLMYGSQATWAWCVVYHWVPLSDQPELSLEAGLFLSHLLCCSSPSYKRMRDPTGRVRPVASPSSLHCWTPRRRSVFGRAYRFS